MKKHYLNKPVLLACLSFTLGQVNAEKSSVLMEKAIFLQETKEDYPAAVGVYEEALKESKRENKQSEILFRMADTYEKLGKDEELLKTLKRLIKTGDARNEWVKKAVKLVKELDEAKAPSKKVIAVRDTILKATETRERQPFLNVCSKRMQEALTEELFESSCDMVTPLLEVGYELSLKSADTSGLYQTYVWWVECKDSAKITLTILFDREGLVGGAYYR
ncbi:tetratricopeptide repeat protein [Rubritalea sp.]|uniref:tetratricopeptide repeat protein n=1 Tax=Rubritalea sp. TaxID=2109375 RepID=UPI003EFA2427